MGEGGNSYGRRVGRGKSTKRSCVSRSAGVLNLSTLSQKLCTLKSEKFLHEARKSLSCCVINMNRSRRASSKQKKAAQPESGCEKDGGKSRRNLALSGKIVYLDIKDTRHAQSIENKLKKLGAVIETFLSKDLNYVISSSAPSRSSSQAKGQGDSLGPESPSFVNTPSPYSSTPSPTYKNVGGKIVPVTRGQAMAQIARARNRSPSPSSAVASAEKLGIKIISIEGAEKWLNKELNKLGHADKDDAEDSQASSKKKKSGFIKCKKLQHPYIKVEATNHHYRPFFLELPVWPHINVDTPAATCPFDGKGVASVQRSGRGDKDGLASIGHYQTPGSQSASHRRSVEGEDSSRLVGYPILTAGDLRRQRERRRKEQRRRGYCECCAVKYDDIDKHVQEQGHKDFARDKSNYDSLDELMRACPSTGEFLRNTLLQHCKQRASVKPITSAQREDTATDSSGDNGSEQVVTVNPSTPAKPQVSAATLAVTAAGVPASVAGNVTPTRTLQRPIWSDISPATKKRSYYQEGVCAQDEGGEPSRHGNQSKVKSTLSPNTDINGEGNAKDGPEKDSSALLPAVVIRRPGVKGVYGSPCRKLGLGMSPQQREAERTPKKVRERSMIFGDTSIASLQPMPEDLVSVPIAMRGSAGLKDSTASRGEDVRAALQGDRGRKRRRELSGGEGHPKARRSLRAVSTQGSESLDVEEDEVNMIPLTVSPQKVSLGRAAKKDLVDNTLCSSVHEKDSSSNSTFAAASLSRSSLKLDTVKVMEGSSEMNRSGRHGTNSHSKDRTLEKGENFPDSAENSHSDKTAHRTEVKQSVKAEKDSKSSRQEDGEQRKSSKKEERSKNKESKQASELVQQESLPSKETPAKAKNSCSVGVAEKLCNPPVTPQRTPRKGTRSPVVFSPSAKVQTTPTRRQQQLQEEEMGSSPIYSRAAIHTSTPIVLTTRKLRHVDDAISQDVDAVRQLLENSEQQQSRKGQRSCNGENSIAETLSQAEEEGSTQTSDGKLDECLTPKRRSLRNIKALETANLQSESSKKYKDAKLDAKLVEPCSPEKKTATIEAEMFRTPEKLQEQTVRSLRMALVRCEHPSPQSSTKKVKLSKSWRLLSDNSMTRLLQSESEASPFKGFQGNEELPSDLTFEYASEVEVTDDEEREWLIDEEESGAEEEKESDFDESLQEFIPTFSSPGKRSDSSWDDACDSYLNLTVQQQLLSKPRQARTPQKVSASANKKRKRSKSKSSGTEAGSDLNPKKRQRVHLRRKSSAQLAWGAEAQPGMLTLTKKQCQEKQSDRRGKKDDCGESLRVDEEVVFNYASPCRGKQEFSPLKVLNSNLTWGGLASSLSPRTRSRMADPVKLLTPFSLQ